MKHKLILLVMLISVSLISSSFTTTTFAQMQGSKPCDACGMSVDATGQARYQIFDTTGHQYYACCPVCAFKLIKTYGELNITSFCDYNGPTYPITIIAKNHGSTLTVNPPTATVILGGSCSKNRLVYSNQSADALLSTTNNGTSKWLSPMSNATVASNATRLSIAQAVLQYGGGESVPCEACGMTVDTVGQDRCRIFDSSGTLHIACCPVCALKLLKTYGALNYTAICDYNGPSQTINIVAKNYGADVTVTPSTALVIVGGSCTKNRLVADSASADALLASPNNGTSQWLSPMSNATVASDATRLSVIQAALQYGGGPPPTPTPTPTLTPTPSPTNTGNSNPTPTNKPAATASPTPSPTPTTQATTQDCEACGMEVNPAAQEKYVITDGTGKIHYAECFMCALNLANDYEILHIVTSCDWYGPNYTITIDTSQYGKEVTVSPTTAMFLDGGSCVINRAAYNQTAADALLANGFSQYTLPMQQYALPSTTTVTSVNDAITKIAQTNIADTTQGLSTTMVLALGAVVGIAIIIGSIVAFKKLKK